MFKTTLQILLGIVLVAQLTGCFYHDEGWHHDHDRNYGHQDHHEDHGHDPVVDVHLHG